ncbi:hypothetical protein A4G99_20920 [Haladaptatus sp. R4]|uniref:hypothetical protein n=1 Tax=Haladaptatus sp. R4 TaxID=1679489 RepID=UPI0007B46BAF|nr:hypothetical protein [Haladaptatus sp. R4]KZN26507.1 hypothetical protein A4G99_20920 [Haladaptatus sp. R4]
MSGHESGGSERDTVEANIGYDGEGGKRAALDAAVTVVREFESLDVVTVVIPRTKWEELDGHPEIRYVEENAQSGA